MEHLLHRGFDAFVGVGDDELDAAQPARRQGAKELRPEGLCLRGPESLAQNLAAAVRIHADSHYRRDRDDPAAFTHLHVSGVDPHVGPGAFDRPVEELLDAAVDLLAKPRHLALGDAGHAHRLDQIVDGSRRDAVHVGFLDHRDHGLVGGAARLEKRREIRALAKLRDCHRHGADAGVPLARAIAVALVRSLRRPLAVGRTREAFDLDVHHARGDEGQHLPEEILIGALLKQLLHCHLSMVMGFGSCPFECGNPNQERVGP